MTNMLLNDITPVILTFNEEANIERTLFSLIWAKDILIVDSFSTDQTLVIAKRFPQTRVVQHPFKDFSEQRNFALTQGGIKTEWVLMLDADFIIPKETILEMNHLNSTDVSAYQAGFIYCLNGEPLRSTLYPPREILFRKSCAHYIPNGHSEKAVIQGAVKKILYNVMHDDRKSLSVWLDAQRKYAWQEVKHLYQGNKGKLSLPDRIRKTKWIAPWLILLYCLFGKGLIRDGFPGIYYSFQRMYAECLLSIMLIAKDLSKRYS